MMKPTFLALLALLVPVHFAHAHDTPQRIVSAGGDLTEIVYALGAQDRLVGVDSTSTYPAGAVKLPQIGYVRRLSAEGVLSLRPDLVLAAYDAGPDAAITQFDAAGVAVARAPNAESPDGVIEKIRFVGQALHLDDQAEALARKVAEELAEARREAADKPTMQRVIFVIAAGEGAPMVGGENTSAQRIIELSGGINAVTGFEGYKPMSREAILEAQPDVLLMMTSSAERLGGIDAVLSRPELALTPAGRNRRAITMDGMLLLGFGPRTPEAIRTLSGALRAQP